ncbi:MAG TPA: hypothetical protein VGX91_08805 [Candidatus Cybelea sp.]|jgi:hypothetical protein|nr:hypothetical protein [Candidatus Cybelea sp.]
MQTLRRFAPVTTIAAALAAGSFALPARAVDTVPFTEVGGGLIGVQGSVDGGSAVPMLVNLGAGVDVLASGIGRRYVVVDGKYVSLRLTGERVDLPIGTVQTLAIGGVRLDAPHVGIWSGLDGTPAQGLISATAFRNITATFDFRAHQIVIEDAETFPERVRMAQKVPLVLQDDLGIALGIFARFDFGNGKSGLCEINTGATGITLDRTFAAANGLNPSGGSQTRLTSIALRGASQTAIAEPTVAVGDLIYDCSVGNSFWAGRIFTLDLPNRYIYIST